MFSSFSIACVEAYTAHGSAVKFRGYYNHCDKVLSSWKQFGPIGLARIHAGVSVTESSRYITLPILMVICQMFLEKNVTGLFVVIILYVAVLRFQLLFLAIFLPFQRISYLWSNVHRLHHLWSQAVYSASTKGFILSVADMSPFHQMWVFKMSYRHLGTVSVCVCMHPSYTYCGSSLFLMGHHMAMYRMNLERHDACEATSAPVEKMESSVQHRSKTGAEISTEVRTMLY